MFGLIFANASQFGEFDGIAALFPLNSAIGILIVVASIGAVSLSVFGLKWGTDLSKALRGQSADGSWSFIV